MHNLQLLVDRLVFKASELIENSTTNLAASWMHIKYKYDGGKVVTAHKVVHGNIAVRVLGYIRIESSLGATLLGRNDKLTSK